MKILVCGAAGWTGRAVLANLSGQHDVRAFDLDANSWKTWEDVDGAAPDDVERVNGDIADFDTVFQLVSGMDAVIHLTVHFPSFDDEELAARDDRAFLVNHKGLWNVLEASRRLGIQRVVHMGSCHAVHPQGTFFSSEVRRPDGHLYAVCKRLQEEMCRQFFEAHRLSIVVFRPDYIVDARIGMGRFREQLSCDSREADGGWVCRHDLAQACRLAVEHPSLEFEILHVVGSAGADQTCNVNRTRELLGLSFQGDVDQYRTT